MKSIDENIIYIDRKDGKRHKEVVMGDGFVRFAYQTMAGRLLFPFIFGSSLLSRLLGSYFDSSWSKNRIRQTIDELGIDEREFELNVESFKTFNEFFYRKLKPETRPYDNSSEVVVAPADGRILVYGHSIDDMYVRVKGCIDKVSNLFGKDMHEFDQGQVAVIRLCPADYHRFHFPCDGSIIEKGKVKGGYHSVNPIALLVKKNIFCLNKREYCIMDTGFGKVAFLEVGAFGVGGIVQTYQGGDVKKMDEKGYFKFGGSTILLLFQKDRIKFSHDLTEHSDHGFETLVRAGETIATKL